MDDRKRLQESWARTTAHLRRAARLLPEVPAPSEDGRVEQFREYLEHNELELALDALEALGECNPVPSEFWGHLREAAAEMRLEKHVARLAERSGRTPG